MKAVLKHELSGYFHSLTAYVFGAFLLVFVGIGSMLYNIQQAVANFEYVLGFISLIFVGLVPILTMRVLAEERKQRTDQLLYSLPITTTDIILGKYLALLVVFLIPLVIVAFYPLIFAKFGDVYLLTSYGSLIAFFIMGAALIAIGMFISSLTENLGMAAGICVAVVLFNYYSVSLADYISSSVIGSIIALVVLILIVGLIIKILTKNDAVAAGVAAVLLIAVAVIYFAKKSVFEGLLPNIMKTLSLFERFYTFVNGVFDMTVIVFYLSVIVFFLFLCVQSLEKRRYNYAFQAPYILMPTIESSDITDPLLDESYYAIVPIARGLEVGNTDKDVNVTSLLTTSDEAYSKVAGYNLTTYDKEDGDTDGPFALGVDITQDENDGQMIWYASSYLVDDTYNSYSSGANLDLVMNSISSLVGQRDAVSIRSKSLQYNYLTISDSTSSILKLVMIGVFPIVYLAVGIAIVVKRRRANEAN